jgi:acyl carrier protein
MTTKDQIRAFVRSNFFVSDDAGFTDAASLLDLGVVDSTGVLELIGFLEESFGFTVEDDDVVPENFDSIDRIAAYVGLKLAATA